MCIRDSTYPCGTSGTQADRKTDTHTCHTYPLVPSRSGTSRPAGPGRKPRPHADARSADAERTATNSCRFERGGRWQVRKMGRLRV